MLHSICSLLPPYKRLYLGPKLGEREIKSKMFFFNLTQIYEKRKCRKQRTVGTKVFMSIRLWKYWAVRTWAVGTKHCGNRDFGNIELWEHWVVGTRGCGNKGLWKHRTVGT